MATIAETPQGQEASGASKDKSKTPAVPPTTPMAFVEELPPEIAPGSFGVSKWPNIMRELIEKYELNMVPVVVEDGEQKFAWCNVQQYAKKFGARDALKRLEEDGHPWTVDLKVKAKYFEFTARQLPGGGSAIFVRAIMQQQGEDA